MLYLAVEDVAIYKTKAFAKWADSELISDRALEKAANEIMQGLVDAKLGAGVCKKRVAVPGRGKRGGARTLVAYQAASKAFFIYGFLKNEKDNIDKKELKGIKQYAQVLLSLKEKQLQELLAQGEICIIEQEV